MKNVAPGDQVEIEFVRGAETQVVQVETFSPSVNMTRVLEGDQGGVLLSGWSGGVVGLMPEFVDMEPTLAAYFGVQEGVLVVKGEKSAGLQAGDVLLDVGGDKITSVLQAYQVLGEHEGSVSAKVIRERVEKYVQVDGSNYMGLDMSNTNKIHIIRKEVHDDGDVKIDNRIDDKP